MSPSHLSDSVEVVRVGDKVGLTVDNGGSLASVTLTLEEAAQLILELRDAVRGPLAK